jgi:hypothetical protein
VPQMLKPSDVYPRTLSAALRNHGEYVYAYYEPDGVQPFYVGKGKGTRVLAHWKNALAKNPKALEEHEHCIRRILRDKKVPHIQLLAYNLEKNKEKRYALAERVLQDAFGIKFVWEKVSTETDARLKQKKAALLQKRQDSARNLPRSLEAVVAAASVGRNLDKGKLSDLAKGLKLPILLVGLSKTFHPSYSADDLREMARMYWNLDKFEGTTLPQLRKGKAALLAWSSHLGGNPVIVGAWRIEGNKGKRQGGRYRFPAFDAPELRRCFLGCRLKGGVKRWQGQTIYLGTPTV